MIQGRRSEKKFGKVNLVISSRRKKAANETCVEKIVEENHVDVKNQPQLEILSEKDGYVWETI